MAFLGFEEDYEKVKEERNTLETTEGQKRITSDDIDPLDDETLAMLDSCIPKHDPLLVYMQSDIEFYDKALYDMDQNDVDEEDPFIPKDLLRDVKSLRKVYTRYDEYARDILKRKKYIELLEEKYGGSDRFWMLNDLGGIKDYFPREPLFSPHSDEYDKFLEGPTIETDYSPYSTEKFKERCDQLAEMRGIDRDEITIRGDVASSYRHRSILDECRDTPARIRTTYNNTIGSVSYNEVQELNNLFKSWYQPDEVKSNRFVDSDFGSETPAAIRYKYFTDKPVNAEGFITKVLSGDYVEEDNYDPNEMVIDSASGRTMTRAEQDKRKAIKMLADCGFDDLKLMRHFSVGSEYELRAKQEELRRRRRGKKKAKSLVSDIMGENVFESTTIEDLEKFLFND